MRISSKSWHLRLVRLFDDTYLPRDLCSYFWRVLFSIILLPILLPIISIIFIFVVVENISDRIYERRSRLGRKKEKKPNLFFEFIKAKKEKICPLIEVIEENYDY